MTTPDGKDRTHERPRHPRGTAGDPQEAGGGEAARPPRLPLVRTAAIGAFRYTGPATGKCAISWRSDPHELQTDLCRMWKPTGENSGHGSDKTAAAHSLKATLTVAGSFNRLAGSMKSEESPLVTAEDIYRRCLQATKPRLGQFDSKRGSRSGRRRIVGGRKQANLWEMPKSPSGFAILVTLGLFTTTCEIRPPAGQKLTKDRHRGATDQIILFPFPTLWRFDGQSTRHS